MFRKTGKLVSLSEQELVDCTFDYDNLGCAGGFPDNGFRYIAQNGGIDTEKSYPYEGWSDEICHFNSANIGGEDIGFVDVQPDKVRTRSLKLSD